MDQAHVLGGGGALYQNRQREEVRPLHLIPPDDDAADENDA
eukprot:CAMPEP_0185821276 /NCGR_PEP_ID=MMETSP1322-20130828/24965_1 /TAXON_ID=265543 /ORGANISM="Minutocellus polymorphus, Strain RCC2270" /LENGTH=40 /DNA_ID= /DNA_START= /DNA_END= /DNA_ORIENTATION=